MTKKLVVVLSLLATAVLAQGTRTVKDVRVSGNVRLDAQSILYYANLGVGSAYDPTAARQDFRELWDTGFFQDLRLEVEEVEGGVVLVWHVLERPILSSVRFEGNDGVVEEDLKSHLSDNGIELLEGSPFGLGQIERARVLMTEYYREQGYRFAAIDVQVADSDAGKDVRVVIDEGAKVKIGSIEFEGNQQLSDDELQKIFKKTKTGGMLCFINKHCVYNDANFNEDIQRPSDWYWNNGYINFRLGEPDIRSEGTGDERRLHITVPIEEGTQFKVGTVDVEGNTAYPNQLLLALDELTPGKPFSRETMSESREKMAEIYGVKGYFSVLIQPDLRFGDAPDVVDVTYKITENDKYYLHRVNFRGNTTTKDKVIRRQMSIQEGDLFNTIRFKRSLFRIYQLGYFSEPQPKIEPSPEDPTKLDVTIDLQEQGRNDIRFGGGYSGVEGFFGTFAFSTRNLFGSGNTLTIDLQAGASVKQYRVAYSDPWLFDKPISAGIDLFNREVEFTDFEQDGRGIIGTLGFRPADFWFLTTSYRYEEVDQRPRQFFDADGNPIPIDPVLEEFYTDFRRVSSIQPVLVYSSIDNPVKPWRGLRQLFSLEYAGGFLGGTSNLIKPRIETTFHLPITRQRVGLALHGEVGWVNGFGGIEVPQFEKFFLGGERSIRGYPSFEIGPVEVDPNGFERVVGGDKMLQLNAELQFRVADPVALVLFADAGNAYAEEESISLSDLEKSFGAEVRFWTPLLQAPLRLIWAYVPEPLSLNGFTEPKTNFTFSIGTTF